MRSVSRLKVETASSDVATSGCRGWSRNVVSGGRAAAAGVCALCAGASIYLLNSPSYYLFDYFLDLDYLLRLGGLGLNDPSDYLLLDHGFFYDPTSHYRRRLRGCHDLFDRDFLYDLHDLDFTC